MPNIIKLLKGFQLNHESIKQIEETAAFLAQSVALTVQTNSRELVEG